MFTPFSQVPVGYDDFLSRPVTVLVRTKGRNLAGFSASVRRALSSVDPGLTGHIQTVDQIVSRSLAQPSFRTVAIDVFGAIALVLSMVGIYGVISTGIASDIRNIGIRVALGATRGDVLKLAIMRGMTTVGIGVLLGLCISLLLARFVGSLLFEVSATDPMSIIDAIFVLSCTSLAAIYLPARRAIKLDPAVVLRHQ